jgi:hypothetical protein
MLAVYCAEVSHQVFDANEFFLDLVRGYRLTDRGMDEVVRYLLQFGMINSREKVLRSLEKNHCNYDQTRNTIENYVEDQKEPESN